jgi:hypothetical protein
MSKKVLEPGKKQLLGDTAREATAPEVRGCATRICV